METFSDALLRVTSEVGKIKDKSKLEAYIKALPFSYQSNSLLKGLFDKRRKHLDTLTHAS